MDTTNHTESDSGHFIVMFITKLKLFTCGLLFNRILYFIQFPSFPVIYLYEKGGHVKVMAKLELPLTVFQIQIIK